MRLFMQELRKIWRPGAVAALVFAGVLFYGLFGMGAATGFPHGSQSVFHYELAHDWAQRFGSSIDRSELTQIADDLAQAGERFTQEVVLVPGAAEAGITSPAAFEAFENKLRELRDRAQDLEAAGAELDAGLEQELAQSEELLDAIIVNDWYEDLYELNLWYNALVHASENVQSDIVRLKQEGRLSDAMQARMTAIGAGEQGFISLMWMQDIEPYVIRLAIWLVIAPVFVAAPFAVRDRLCGIRSLQWGSRTGRAVFWPQVVAAAVSVAAVLAVSVVAWVVPFVPTGVGELLGCLITGPFSDYPCWWDMTLGAYLAARIALACALGMASGLAAFTLARRSTGYVGMLLRVVPVCGAVGGLLVPTLFDHALCMHRAPVGPALLRLWWLPAGWEVAVTAVLLVLAILACAAQVLHERRSSC